MMNNEEGFSTVDKKIHQFGMRRTPKSAIYKRKKQVEEEGKQR